MSARYPNNTNNANSTATATERLTGTCRWFDSKRGYGFVVSDSDGSDFFVHQTAIQCDGFRKLVEGQPVSFGLTQDETGRTKASEVVCGEMPSSAERRRMRKQNEATREEAE